MATFNGSDVDAVLKLVASMSDDPDTQLSILALSFVLGCNVCGVSKEGALGVVAQIFDAEANDR